MKVIARKRREGKTQELIDIADKKRVYIVCSSTQEADRISKIARDQGKKIFFPLTFDEFLKKQYATRNIDGFLFDNVDQFISSISSVKIIAMTITTDE